MDLTYLRDAGLGITVLINQSLVPALMAVAFVVFLYGVYKYFILGAGDEAKREDGKKSITYGIIGFVIMFSVWALVNLTIDTLGLRGFTNVLTPPVLGPTR